MLLIEMQKFLSDTGQVEQSSEKTTSVLSNIVVDMKQALNLNIPKMASILIGNKKKVFMTICIFVHSGHNSLT